jgi:hypothetical protein
VTDDTRQASAMDEIRACRGAVGFRPLSPTDGSAAAVSATVLSGRTAGSGPARRAEIWAAHHGRRSKGSY